MLPRSLLPRLARLPLVRELHTTSGPDQIKKLFDSSKYFKNFTQSGYLLFTASNVGLFKNSQLQNPEGLVDFSRASLSQAQNLVRDMVVEAKNTDDGKLTYIRKLDQLSDILCRVIDVAEFIRVVHPSQKWVDAAQQTHEMMFEYMNQLNTNVELYKILANILDLRVAQELSSEEVEVGKYLRQDFERSGIAMDPHTRDNFVAITQQISLLGSQFNNEIHNLELYWCAVPRHEFERLEDQKLKLEIDALQARAPRASKSQVQIPLAGHIPYTLLTKCPSEEIRKQVWIALHNSPKDQIKTLDGFVKYRALLANMLGYKSYADYTLEHKMAKSPENVKTFLKNLQLSLLEKKDGVVSEVRRLYKFKPNCKPLVSDERVLDTVKPWDRDYLLALEAQSNEISGGSTDSSELATPEISEFLSVGTIMSGLDKLFRSIYNVALIPEKTAKGETWDHDQVRKLSYVDLSSNEVLGYLYVDFWSAKVLPSHFTIVCSRELNSAIGSEHREDLAKLVHLSPDADYQLPVISLVCNFARPKSASIAGFAGRDDDCPTLLTLEQVDTIFHEMGHATHSMLGRTRLHNLSGTRCLTDFVELPSVLMELFSNDPRVLCKIASHYKTGEPLPEKLLLENQAKRDMLKHSEQYMQLKMALLDQVLHDENVVDFLSESSFQNFSSTEIYHALEKQLKVFSDEYLTWHGKFPHLFSYGAVYYSYLLDRAIAEKIWSGLFEKDPWSREAGEKYKQSILKWGGTRDPWHCLAEALNEPALRKADSRAMEIIGHL